MGMRLNEHLSKENLEFLERNVAECFASSHGWYYELNHRLRHRLHVLVERARAKRRLREVFRLNRHLLPSGFRPDIVLVARRSILSAPWPRLVADYAALVRRLQP